MSSVNVVVVGDNNAGKTSLCITFSTDQFPSLFTPMECNRVPHEKDIEIDGRTIHVSCTDTEGHEDYDDSRPESYEGADVFLLCYSISGKTSLQNVKTKWMPELKKYSPKTPIVLVGCKQDTRNSKANKSDLVAKAQGRKMKATIKVASYVECSALKKIAVNECFIEAVRVACGKGSSGGCKCVIL